MNMRDKDLTYIHTHMENIILMRSFDFNSTPVIKGYTQNTFRFIIWADFIFHSHRNTRGKNRSNNIITTKERKVALFVGAFYVMASLFCFANTALPLDGV